MGRSMTLLKGGGIPATWLKLRTSKKRHDSAAARFSDVSLNAIDAAVSSLKLIADEAGHTRRLCKVKMNAKTASFLFN